MLRSHSNNNEMQRLLFLLHRRGWQFCSSLHQAIAIFSGEPLLVWESQGRMDPAWLSNLTLFAGPAVGEEKKSLFFAWKLNCYIEETVAIIMLGSGCGVREVGKKRGPGSELHARWQRAASQCTSRSATLWICTSIKMPWKAWAFVKSIWISHQE